jgi:hypothetical protein
MTTLKFFKKKCYVLIAYSPGGMSLSEADVAFNEFISDKSNGMVLFHDHFVGRSGGIAIFFVDSQGELDSLQSKERLKDWELQIYPLTFTEIPVEFLYQIDFTMGVYRGKRLRQLYSEYEGGEYSKNVDAHVVRN